MARRNTRRRVVAPTKKIDKNFKKIDIDGNVLTPTAYNKRIVAKLPNGDIVCDKDGRPISYKQIRDYRQRD